MCPRTRNELDVDTGLGQRRTADRADAAGKLPMSARSPKRFTSSSNEAPGLPHVRRSAATAWPFRAVAQPQPKVHHIVFLTSGFGTGAAFDLRWLADQRKSRYRQCASD
jgi:hypothetical protein